MKKLIRQLLFIVPGLFMLMLGCSKNFTVQTPSDSIPLSEALNTVDELQSALNGAYASLRSTTLFGLDFTILGDLQADNCYVQMQNHNLFIAQYTYSVSAADGVALEMWAAAYTGILNANEIINATVSTPAADTIKAQAYAIRALLYFKLANIYARPYTDDSTAPGVPLVLTYNPYLLPARSAVKEVYGQILNDLKAALRNAPDYFNSVHLSKYAIEGLMARVYLYEGDKQDAKIAALDVINHSGFSLVAPADFNAFWANPAPQSDQTEVMFEVDADPLNNNGSVSIGGVYINGLQDFFVSSQLYDLYSATDIRRTLFVPYITPGGASVYLNNKFPNALNADPDNYKVIRLSEVYLIAAEASLPGNEADARQYLNALMAERDPSFVYNSTGKDLLSDIVQERRKELAFEGDRLSDLNRLKLPVARGANPAALPAGPGNINLVIPYADYRRIAPIPLTEIEANPSIASEQNTGY